MAETDLTQQWEALYREVAAEVATWRRQHPQATFNEIEAVIDQRMNQLRAQMLADAAVVGEVTATVDAAAPVCPSCGTRAVWRGQKKRRLQTQGGQELTLHRHHAICPHCGQAFFPPG